MRRAPLFYGVYFASLGLAAALVLASTSLVRLAISVEIMNALLLPIVLGFLLALAWKVLPQPYRLRPIERATLLLVVGGIIGVGLALAGTALGL